MEDPLPITGIPTISLPFPFHLELETAAEVDVEERKAARGRKVAGSDILARVKLLAHLSMMWSLLNEVPRGTERRSLSRRRRGNLSES